MKTKPTLTVNLHCAEGRSMFQLDLDSFSSEQLVSMVRLIGLAKKGAELAVEPTDDGRHCMKFTLGLPVVERVQ